MQKTEGLFTEDVWPEEIRKDPYSVIEKISESPYSSSGILADAEYCYAVLLNADVYRRNENIKPGRVINPRDLQFGLFKLIEEIRANKQLNILIREGEKNMAGLFSITLCREIGKRELVEIRRKLRAIKMQEEKERRERRDRFDIIK